MHKPTAKPPRCPLLSIMEPWLDPSRKFSPTTSARRPSCCRAPCSCRLRKK